MKLFLYGEVSPANSRLQVQLSYRGYTTEMIGQRPWAGTPTEGKRRRAMVQRMLECHGVAMPAGQLGSEELLRLKVLCDALMLPLLHVDALPDNAPDMPADLWHYALLRPVRCTWMPEEAQVVVPASQPLPRVKDAVARAAQLWHHFEGKANRFFGDGLKNPNTRRAAG